jgi:hypothetical protein
MLSPLPMTPRTRTSEHASSSSPAPMYVIISAVAERGVSGADLIEER